ncbi:MAG TPA: hypothetical protein VIV65_10675 [Gemmatimonadaceae bacterium]|jgi:hypothetical protein
MRIVTALLAASALGLPVSKGYGQTYTCLPASDSLTINLLGYVVGLVTSTDSTSVAHRVRYGLPTTTASKVTVVTAAKTCTTAAAKYHSAVRPAGTPAISRTLIVIKIGSTNYVVQDINEAAGEFGRTVIFDKNWVRLTEWNS